MGVVDYASFLASKARTTPDAGVVVDPDDMHPSLFAFQRDLVAWAAERRRRPGQRRRAPHLPAAASPH